MGALQSKKYTSNQTKLELNIQIGKQILPQFLILKHWSLQQIRSVYQIFTRYSAQCPFIDAFTFHKIMPFQGSISRKLFSEFSRKGESTRLIKQNNMHLNYAVLQYLQTKTSMQICFYQVLYLIFDFNHEKQLKMKHFVLIYESTYIAYLKITGQYLPSHQHIKKYLYEYYLKSQTLQVLQRNIEFRKLIQQVQGSAKINRLFFLFEQQSILQKKQNPNTFSFVGIKKYDKEQSSKIFRIIKKVYQDKNYQDVDLVQKNKRFRLQNRKINCLTKIQSDNQRKFQSTSNFRIKNRSYSVKNSLRSTQKIVYNGQIQNNQHNLKEKYQTFANFNPQKYSYSDLKNNLDKFSNNKSLRKQNQKFFNIDQKNKQTKFALESKIGFQVSQKSLFSTLKGQKQLKSHFTKGTNQKKRSMIFLNGKTHSKKQIFQLMDYFNTLSNNKQEIKIKEFFKTFDQKSFLKKQLTSFFRYFDQNKNGIVSFQQFIKACYPGISEANMQKIFSFFEEYRQIYHAATVFNTRKENKNVIELPSETTQRIIEIFNSLDKKKKGFLQFQDLKSAYTSHTMKDLEQIIKNYGTEGKVYIDGLCRMLLPQGWSIQKNNWHIKKP